MHLTGQNRILFTRLTVCGPLGCFSFLIVFTSWKSSADLQLINEIQAVVDLALKPRQRTVTSSPSSSLSASKVLAVHPDKCVTSTSFRDEISLGTQFVVQGCPNSGIALSYSLTLSALRIGSEESSNADIVYTESTVLSQFHKLLTQRWNQDGSLFFFHF